MAREIDLTKPLSAEDRQYLVDRCAWSRIAQADQIAADEAQAKAVEQNEITTPQPTPTATGAAALHAAQTAQEEQAASDDEEEAPYEEWSYDDLKAELDRRKQLELDGGMAQEEANKLFSKGGSQKDLVARLYADDERYDS